MNNKKYKVLDLFAGAGGFSLGFKILQNGGQHPFEIVGAVEIDEGAVKTLRSAMIREGLSSEEAEKRVICNDITSNETKKELYKICPEVDIIIGGPPCQSFSMIGPRSGCKDKQARFANDERDSLFEHYIEIVNYYLHERKTLKFIVFENVKGIISKKDPQGNKYIDIITNRFEELGLTLENENCNLNTKYIVLNAADYGVPQLRERVFIIGNSLQIKNPFPKPTHCPHQCVSESKLLPYVTLKDAIGDLPRVIPKLTLTPREKGRSVKDLPEEIKNKIKNRNAHRNNGNDETNYHKDLFLKSYQQGNYSRKHFLDFIKPKRFDIKLTGHIARNQQESDIQLFKGMKPGTSSKDIKNSNRPKDIALRSLIKYGMDSFEDKYKKLSWERPCSTVFAHLQKDGNRFIHPDSSQGRTITVREAARIQSFPDDYIFEAPGNVRYRYIGNAVPPLLSMAIAKALFSVLCKKNSEA